MEERRRSYDNNWEEVKNFIADSRDYRSRDEVTQKYQVDTIQKLENQVKTQNGRVFGLEKWREEIEQKIKQKKDNYSTAQAIITVMATVVMAASAMIMIFKK